MNPALHISCLHKSESSKFEDVLESSVTHQLLAQDDRKRNQFSIELMDLGQYIHSFAERVTELKRVYTGVLKKMLGEEDDGVISSVTDFPEIKTDMVGLSDQFLETKGWLVNGCKPYLRVVTVVGMGGIGKTTLAKKIFHDPDVKTLFYPRLWVKIGRKCRTEEILRVLIAQLNPGNDQILAQGEEDMGEYLKKSLHGRRFLIVVDDLWEEEDLNGLLTSISFDENDCQVLVTSRISQPVIFSSLEVDVRFLNKEESWELLCEKVFGRKSCPRPLVPRGFLKESPI